MNVQRQCRKLIAANRKDKQGAYIEETLETLDKRKNRENIAKKFAY